MTSSVPQANQSPATVLASVQCLAPARPQISGEPEALISEFLDSRLLWDIPRACAHGDVALLRRIAEYQDLHPAEWTKDEPLYRASQFSDATVVAARLGNLEVLKWLMTEYDTKTTAIKVVEEAAKHGHRHILEWLYATFEDGNESADRRAKRALWYGNELDNAVASNDIDTARWIWERNGAGPPWLGMTAAEVGDMDMIKWLHSVDVEFKTRSVALAGEKGHLEALQFLAEIWDSLYAGDGPNDFDDFDERMINDPDRYWMEQSCDHGLDEYWYDTNPWRKDDFVDTVAENGHLNVVQWLHANGCSGFTSGAIDRAAGNGHLHVVEWLHTNRSEGCTIKAMDSAATNGHLDVVEWLHANRSEGCSTSAMDEAAANGHLDVVQWLHDHRSEGCTTRAMDGAAANNHADVFHWLVEHRTEGCTSAAMDDAAGNGHLEMVQWLHENRPEGCTARAMDSAAAGGHLNVVEWLHCTRAEGCTVDAMDGAAAGGHFGLLKWLHEHRSEGCSTAAIDGAAGIGRLDIIQWLEREYGRGCTEVAMKRAARHGYFSVLLYLFHKKMAKLTDSTGAAAASGGHAEIVMWCEERGAIYHIEACFRAEQHGHWHLVRMLA